jgi:hypothetical protein
MLIIGSRYAAVLPVPVCADAIRSLPARIKGITCSCTGVAFSYPVASIPSTRDSCNPNSLKFKVGNN